MAHLPDSTPEPSRRADHRKAFRSYSDDERARMRNILQNMGTKGAASSPAVGPAAGATSKPPRKAIIAGIAILLVGVGGLWLLRPDANAIASDTRTAGSAEPDAAASQEPTAAASPDVAPQSSGATDSASVAAAGPTLEASGKIVAKRMATVSSDLTGRVTELLAKEGDAVEKGQPVARLDDHAAKAQLAIAEANVIASEDEYAVVAAELEAMSDNLQRTTTLAQRGVASKEALSTLEGQYAVLEARVAASNRQIDVQRRQLDAMRNDLNQTLIRSPFSGVVTEITANIGEIVSPVSPGGYTQSGIATIVDPQSIVGEVNVNEQFLSKIEDGQKVEMTVPAWPDRTFSGHVSLITPIVDDSTAAVKVTVTFDPVPENIYPGMRLDVAFFSDSDEPDS